MKKWLLIIGLAFTATFAHAQQIIVQRSNPALYTTATSLSLNSVIRSSTTDNSGKTLFTSIIVPSSVSYMTTCVAWRNGGPTVISSVTYASISYSTITTVSNPASGGDAIGCYDLISPVAGTAYLFVGTAANTGFGQITYLWNSANAVSPRGSTTSSSDYSASGTSSTDTVTSAVGEIVTDFFAGYMSPTAVITPGAGQTSRIPIGGTAFASAGDGGVMMSSTKPGAASVTMSEVSTAAGKLGHIVFAVKP